VLQFATIVLELETSQTNIQVINKFLVMVPESPGWESLPDGEMEVENGGDCRHYSGQTTRIEWGSLHTVDRLILRRSIAAVMLHTTQV
jgi:hypothetical protein